MAAPPTRMSSTENLSRSLDKLNFMLESASWKSASSSSSSLPRQQQQQQQQQQQRQQKNASPSSSPPLLPMKKSPSNAADLLAKLERLERASSNRARARGGSDEGTNGRAKTQQQQQQQQRGLGESKDDGGDVASSLARHNSGNNSNNSRGRKKQQQQQQQQEVVVNDTMDTSGEAAVGEGQHNEGVAKEVGDDAMMMGETGADEQPQPQQPPPPSAEPAKKKRVLRYNRQRSKKKASPSSSSSSAAAAASGRIRRQTSRHGTMPVPMSSRRPATARRKTSFDDNTPAARTTRATRSRSVHRMKVKAPKQLDPLPHHESKGRKAAGASSASSSSSSMRRRAKSTKRQPSHYVGKVKPLMHQPLKLSIGDGVAHIDFEHMFHSDGTMEIYGPPPPAPPDSDDDVDADMGEWFDDEKHNSTSTGGANGDADAGVRQGRDAPDSPVPPPTADFDDFTSDEEMAPGIDEVKRVMGERHMSE